MTQEKTYNLTTDNRSINGIRPKVNVNEKQLVNAIKNVLRWRKDHIARYLKTGSRNYDDVIVYLYERGYGS